jgi:serine/threonine protein kinase
MKPMWRAVCAGSQTRARYTLEYASPEVIRAVGAMRAHFVECKPSMDIWSLGVIIFEVLTGKAFFPLECNRDAMKDGLIGLEPLPVEEDPKVFQRIPAEGNLRSTVKAMLSRETDKRPTAEQVRSSVKECLKALTGEMVEDPGDGGHNSPMSSLGRPDSNMGLI